MTPDKWSEGYRRRHDEGCPQLVTCKRCGANNLEWDQPYQSGGLVKPYLVEFTTGKKHECNFASDFD